MKTPATSHTSVEQGWLGWIKRLFHPAVPANTPAAPKLRVAAGREASAVKPSVVDAAWHEYCPSFAVYAQALGLELEYPPQLTDAQRAHAQQLTAAVLQAASAEEGIPSGMTAASLRVLNLVARSDLEISELASVLQQDPALTAAVLRVANSASMGAVAGPIHTVRDAVTRLGVTESARVAGVVASQALFSPQAKLAQALFAAPLAELHLTASTIAAGAAQLAMQQRSGRSDLAYLGGMLHDVGKTLAFGTLARLIQTGSVERAVEPIVAEEVLEAVHVELGCRAHVHWELPEYLTQLCAAQHEPSLPHDAAHAEQHLVRVASGLVALRTRPQPKHRLEELSDSLRALDMTPLQVRALDTDLRKRKDQVKAVLKA